MVRQGSGWVTIRLGCLGLLVKSWKMAPGSKGRVKVLNKPYSDVSCSPPFCSNKGCL